MDDERLTRMEEAQAFTERSVETLDAEVRELNERVASLRRAVASLEARLDAMMRAPAKSADESQDA